MKIKDIHKGFSAIDSAIDFISTASDSDETGIGVETLEGLRELIEVLKTEQLKIYVKSALAKIRRQNPKYKKVNNLTVTPSNQ